MTLTRSLANGNLTVGSNLRTPGNLNLTAPAFPSTPTYPITLGTADSTNVFDPNLKTGEVHSFSFGYQRELDKNTVVEFRYVGNRGVGLQRQYNINEFNTIENGFAAEFSKAQANLYGRFIAPAGYGNCVSRYVGECGFKNLIVMDRVSLNWTRLWLKTSESVRSAAFRLKRHFLML